MLPLSAFAVGILSSRSVLALRPRVVSKHRHNLRRNPRRRSQTLPKHQVRTSQPPRFAPLEIHTPAKGSIIDASSETPDISEDDLNLRIARPVGVTKDSKLPVVVHIYGGGVIRGSAYDPHYESDELLSIAVAHGKSIIYVAINYRVWSISGLPGTVLNITSDATTVHTLAVSARLGCGGGLEEEEEVLECLRGVLAEELLDVAMAYSRGDHPPWGLFTFIPWVDDDFLPGRTTALYEAGRSVKGIPIVYGWTQDDGASKASPAQLIQSEEDMLGPIKSFASNLISTQISELFSYYQPSEFQYELANYEARKQPTDPTVSIHFFRLSRILRDMFFTCSSMHFGRAMLEQSKIEVPHQLPFPFNELSFVSIWKMAVEKSVRELFTSDNSTLCTQLSCP